VHAWVDTFDRWRRGLAAKVTAGLDVTSELQEGAILLRAAADRARLARTGDAAEWLRTQADRLDGGPATAERAQAALADQLAALARTYPDRGLAVSYGRDLVVSVDRERARVGAWYEMFPRSWGPDPARSATFREAAAHLERVAAMGFDVVYLPPIHPIGTTARKGRGNALRAAPGDPGSPWAIGSPAGGHKAVDPGLGTLDDFAYFVGVARSLGLEVALDLAYQCSPDHPYVREHPEWFRHRPDGTIKYAENPPKKYQDIYPFDFECEAWPALWEELKSVVEFWVAHGVRIFRVDNPHTKPYRFWEWLIREIRSAHPDVIFLAEAFTRPKVMLYLAKLGFTQSYTYFTWRNTKDEITEYLTELASPEVADVFRPNFFANTPDILHAYLQEGGPPAFRIRLILAATLGPTYGIYSGFELCENAAVPGSEEYLSSEKYQFRQWDVNRPGHITALVTTVNQIRRQQPALWSHGGLTFCETDNPSLLAYYKVAANRSSAVLVVINLDYERMQHGFVTVPTAALGLPADGPYEVTDLLDHARYEWRGDVNYVRLDPAVRAAHVLSLPVAPADVSSGVNLRLQPHLERQRWFAGKARTVAQARIHDWAPAGPRAAGLLAAIAAVTYADGTDERYFAPMALAPDVALAEAGAAPAPPAEIALLDAMEDAAACRALVTVMIEGRSIAMRNGHLQGTAYRDEPAVAVAHVIRSAGEQSNSSVRLGDRLVLKVFRRLEPGQHPELEMSRFLSQRGFSGIPPLVASLEYAGGGETPTSLAVLQGFVPNQGTGWQPAVLDAKRALTARSSGRGAKATAFLKAAELLGQRTAELHLVLASERNDAAFAPEAVTAAYVAATAARMRKSAERVLSRLADRLGTLPPDAAGPARALLDAAPALFARIDGIAAAPATGMRTRVHGDYHLGQVLSAGGDFVIIDFEGEPSRPLDERRAKESPLKDVAGMLRSFSYAVHTAVRDLEQEAGDGRAGQWESAAVAAFATRYRRTLAGSGLVPDTDEAWRQWLDAFVLDKAIYELDYELASRPSWVAIPLLGILRLLRGPDSAPGA
ncbi:MAG: putative maltokinase, partial [Vicinamibacterales bacterium]